MEERVKSIILSYRYLFWTDSGDSPKIEVSDLLGHNRRTIVDNDIESPQGITIDFVDMMLYWVDSQKDTIESAKFNGNNRRVVAFQTGTIFSGIAVFQVILGQKMKQTIVLLE